jgi:hypothetical protein
MELTRHEKFQLLCAMVSGVAHKYHWRDESVDHAIHLIDRKEVDIVRFLDKTHPHAQAHTHTQTNVKSEHQV